MATKTKGTKKRIRVLKTPSNTGKWYDKYDVPATTSNKKLGLTDIRLYAASDAQAKHGIICTAVVKMLGLSIRLLVKESKKNKDELYLNIPGTEKYADANGEVQYYDNVNLDVNLKAQILKYVETQLEE